MRRHRQDIRPLTEMNVTNLLDTAFVLLMAFMIVAPAAQHGLEIKPPEVDGGPIEDENALTVIVQEAKGGFSERIFVDEADRRFTYEELTDHVRTQSLRHDNLNVLIEVDKNVPSEVLLKVFAAIREAGVENVSLPTEPTDKDKE